MNLPLKTLGSYTQQDAETVSLNLKPIGKFLAYCEYYLLPSFKVELIHLGFQTRVIRRRARDI
jgi:hypothetical protein